MRNNRRDKGRREREGDREEERKVETGLRGKREKEQGKGNEFVPE